MEHEEVRPYSREDTKREQVEQMFDRIAPRYDLLNRLLSFGIDTRWRRKAIRHALKENPSNLLDVATGTGDMAILAARKNPSCQITGVDISEEMLGIARKKVLNRNLASNISFVSGDSENLPFGDNSFDVITIAFGVRNFENTINGLRDCHRVLRKNGRLVILEFSRPTVSPFRQLYYTYFKYVLPLIGRITSRDSNAYTYLFESSRVFPAGIDFAKVLEKAGFSGINFQPLTLGICTIYIGKKES